MLVNRTRRRDAMRKEESNNVGRSRKRRNACAKRGKREKSILVVRKKERNHVGRSKKRKIVVGRRRREKSSTEILTLIMSIC